MHHYQVPKRCRQGAKNTFRAVALSVDLGLNGIAPQINKD
jgi:hypothetical protein